MQSRRERDLNLLLLQRFPLGLIVLWFLITLLFMIAISNGKVKTLLIYPTQT